MLTNKLDTHAVNSKIVIPYKTDTGSNINIML